MSTLIGLIKLEITAIFAFSEFLQIEGLDIITSHILTVLAHQLYALSCNTL